MIEATVTQVVKGGVLVDLGMRGFVPASQIRRQPVGNLDELVGQTLRLKVIDLDHKRHRVVLSQRQVLEEELNAKKQELLSELAVGQKRDGVVVRLADFGAFVDLGGVDGLIHNTELSYARIKHPSEVVKVGDEVSVEVMKFDPEAKKVSLSLKHGLPDPWVEHADKLWEGNKLQAQVVKVTPNYLLVEIVPGVLAMVPKGEFDSAVQYNGGEEVELTLISINHATRRITASIQHVADVSPEEIEAIAPETRRRARTRSVKETTPTRLRVGLTGGIGSGKSEAGRLFAGLGALVIDADALAREAVAPGTPGLPQIAPPLARRYRARRHARSRSDGRDRVQRRAGARGAQRDRPPRRARARPRNWRPEAGPEQIVIHEIPLLFESGRMPAFDAPCWSSRRRSADRAGRATQRLPPRRGGAPHGRADRPRRSASGWPRSPSRTTGDLSALAGASRAGLRNALSPSRSSE